MTVTKKPFERLPSNVVPKNYGLTLQPNLTEFTFTGKEVIDVEVWGLLKLTEDKKRNQKIKENLKDSVLYFRFHFQ